MRFFWQKEKKFRSIEAKLKSFDFSWFPDFTSPVYKTSSEMLGLTWKPFGYHFFAKKSWTQISGK